MYYKDSCRAGSEKEQKAVDERQEYSFKHETENNHTLIVMTKANGEHWGKFYRR